MSRGFARNLKKECGGLAAGQAALIDDASCGLIRVSSDAR